MNEELKARLLAWTKTSSRFGLDSIGKDIANALEAIEQLELQLAELDAEIAKYRDAPVVAYLDQDGIVWKDIEQFVAGDKQLIVKPGE